MLEGPGPYLGDACARPGCGHPFNFHSEKDPTTKKHRCLRSIRGDLACNCRVNDMSGQHQVGCASLLEMAPCPCEEFVQEPAHALRDKRWRQSMAASALNGVEVAIGEAFDPDVLEKTAPLVRRIRAILQRATVGGPTA
jgi:hypothetical protein